MRLLLDTHILIWAAVLPERLHQAERDLLTTADKLVVSAVALWEIRLKWDSLHATGARKGPVSPNDVVMVAEEMQWQFLALTARHATTPLAIRLGHRDPFDELLLVQAQEEQLSVLTRDTKLRDHPLALVA